MTQGLLAIAEDAFSVLPHPPRVAVHAEERFVLVHTAAPVAIGGSAQRVRVDGAFDHAVADVRAWFAERRRAEFVWTVGPSTRPRDAERRLLAAGAEPWPEDPVWTGMVLTAPPPRVDGVEVRRVETLADALVVSELVGATSGWPEEVAAREREAVPERWAGRDPERTAAFLACVDGEPVGFATSWYGADGVYLSGGGTLERARGRGAYRALVRARWDDAVARSTPALVVQAGAMSRPILARVGFRAVCEVHALVDRSGA